MEAIKNIDIDSFLETVLLPTILVAGGHSRTESLLPVNTQVVEPRKR
jgi:hypothetical protein